MNSIDVTHSPTRILLVDDDDDLRESLKLLLEMDGFEVTVACNGQEALALLRSGARPSVVLLDLRMPVMDGWQTLEVLGAEGWVPGLPVIVCTSAPRDAPAGFPVLPKPIDFDELLARLTPP